MTEAIFGRHLVWLMSYLKAFKGRVFMSDTAAHQQGAVVHVYIQSVMYVGLNVAPEHSRHSQGSGRIFEFNERSHPPQIPTCRRVLIVSLYFTSYLLLLNHNTKSHLGDAFTVRFPLRTISLNQMMRQLSGRLPYSPVNTLDKLLMRCEKVSPVSRDGDVSHALLLLWA